MTKVMKFVSVAVFFIMTVSVLSSVVSAQTHEPGAAVPNASDRKESPHWDWSDMNIITTPLLPGHGGASNPNHLDRIKITVTSTKPIEQAKFVFTATAWDPIDSQNGEFFMNSSSGNVPDTNWYIELGVSYFYIQPWDKEVQEDAYDTRLLVTAGSKVEWGLSCYNAAESPQWISSPKWNYTVEGAWYREGSTDAQMFKNNIDVKFSPEKPMMGDKVQITLTVKTPPPGRTKPQIFIARVHVSFKFFDQKVNDVTDMQIEATPLQPNLAYMKTAIIEGDWHYKPGIFVSFWVECWQEATKRYWHITSYPDTWSYKVSEAGLWKYPPPKGTFEQNCVISTKPNVIQNPDAAISKDAKGNPQPGANGVTVYVESKFADVPLHPAKPDPKNPYNYYAGTMLWYSIEYDDGFGLYNETGKLKYYPVLPKQPIMNSSKLEFEIPKMQPRTAKGHVCFYVEAWNITKQKAGVVVSDAHPNSPDTVGPDDPYMYNIQESDPGGVDERTSFIVWVYDDRYDMKYIANVNVTFKNGTKLNMPISQTQTNAMGWCQPTKPGSNEPLPLRFGDTVLIEVNYYMYLGGGSSKKELIKANYTYKIEKGKAFKNITLMKEYTSPSNVRNKYIYYVIISEMPDTTANIFFKFNWKPIDPPPIYAEVQPFAGNEFFNTDLPVVMVGTIAALAMLGPAVWMLDKRRRKAEEEEKRVTL